MDSGNIMKIWIIMQARIGSSRLPGKILKPIQGKPILMHDIERCLRIKKAEGIIIATTREPEAEQITSICLQYHSSRVKYYQGSLEDVLSRYYEAAREFAVDLVIRLTSDDPLLDPSLVDSMLDFFLELSQRREGVDYLANNLSPSFPYGLDAEIFRFDTLKKAFQNAVTPYEREHVTPYIRSHPELFQIENYSQEKDESHFRWSLDYPEDFEFVKAVYDLLYPQNPFFDRHDIIRLLSENPELLNINRKYQKIHSIIG